MGLPLSCFLLIFFIITIAFSALLLAMGNFEILSK